jgi:hypothetical protein
MGVRRGRRYAHPGKRIRRTANGRHCPAECRRPCSRHFRRAARHPQSTPPPHVVTPQKTSPPRPNPTSPTPIIRVAPAIEPKHPYRHFDRSRPTPLSLTFASCERVRLFTLSCEGRRENRCPIARFLGDEISLPNFLLCESSVNSAPLRYLLRCSSPQCASLKLRRFSRAMP